MGAIIYQKRGNTNTLPNGQANSNKNKNQFKVTNLAVTPKLEVPSWTSSEHNQIADTQCNVTMKEHPPGNYTPQHPIVERQTNKFNPNAILGSPTYQGPRLCKMVVSGAHCLQSLTFGSVLAAADAVALLHAKAQRVMHSTEHVCSPSEVEEQR